LERTIKQCEALLLEDFKASIKSMKNQGKSRFFYRMKYKDYYYGEKKKANQGKYFYIMKNEKRQRNTMQKEQRKKESKGDNERMLNLKV